MALYPVWCYSGNKKIFLENYADLIILDEHQNLVGIRFGGYPEQVAAMSDAVTIGGAALSAEIGTKPFRAVTPQQPTISGTWRKCMIFSKKAATRFTA